MEGKFFIHKHLVLVLLLVLIILSVVTSQLAPALPKSPIQKSPISPAPSGSQLQGIQSLQLAFPLSSLFNCKDYDYGVNKDVASYITYTYSGKSELLAFGDSCAGSKNLIEYFCPTYGTSASTKIDCSLDNKVCRYDDNLRAYCASPSDVATKNQQDTAVEALLKELDDAFAFTEKQFGPIKTMPEFDNNPDYENYPVDFVEEGLFQQHLVAFLNNDFKKSTAIHSRIIRGIHSSSRDTQRKIDFAISLYYYNLLTKPELAEYQRPGIRAVLGPAISVTEELRYTGVSLTRRVINRDYSKKSASLMGWGGLFFRGEEFVKKKYENPFLKATKNWPSQVGLQCYNFNTGDIDRINHRRYLSFDGIDGSIESSKFDNPMEGMVNFLIDEKLQGANQCDCQQLAKNDFTCPNDFLCASHDGPPTEPQEQRIMVLDPLLPDSEVATTEMMFENICEPKFVRAEFGGNNDGGGGISPVSRTSTCDIGQLQAFASSIGQPTGPQIAHGLMDCASKYAEEERIAGVLGSQGVINPGCQMGVGGDDDKSKIIKCEGSDCDKLKDAAQEAIKRFGDDEKALKSYLKTFCQQCSDADIDNAIATAKLDADGSAIFGTLNDGSTMGGTRINEDGNREIGIDYDALQNGGYYDGAGNWISTVDIMEHEFWHDILDSLIGPSYPDSSGDSNHHYIISSWNNMLGGTPLDVDGQPGGDCSGTAQRINALYQCIEQATGGGPAGGIDPLGPIVYPDPTGAPSTPGVPLLCMGPLDPSSYFNPNGNKPIDCNYYESAPCNDAYGGSASSPLPFPGCGLDETPIDPEVCSQSLCQEGSVPNAGPNGLECIPIGGGGGVGPIDPELFDFSDLLGNSGNTPDPTPDPNPDPSPSPFIIR